MIKDYTLKLLMLFVLKIVLNSGAIGYLMDLWEMHKYGQFYPLASITVIDFLISAFLLICLLIENQVPSNIIKCSIYNYAGRLALCTSLGIVMILVGLSDYE